MEIFRGYLMGLVLGGLIIVRRWEVMLSLFALSLYLEGGGREGKVADGCSQEQQQQIVTVGYMI